MAGRVTTIDWKPIITAPKAGRFILVACKSGYTSTPWVYRVAHYINGYKLPWRDEANDALSDSGHEPMFWCELPVPPNKLPTMNQLEEADEDNDVVDYGDVDDENLVSMLRSRFDGLNDCGQAMLRQLTSANLRLDRANESSLRTELLFERLLSRMPEVENDPGDFTEDDDDDIVDHTGDGMYEDETEDELDVTNDPTPIPVKRAGRGQDKKKRKRPMDRQDRDNERSSEPRADMANETLFNEAPGHDDNDEQDEDW